VHGSSEEYTLREYILLVAAFLATSTEENHGHITDDIDYHWWWHDLSTYQLRLLRSAFKQMEG